MLYVSSRVVGVILWSRKTNTAIHNNGYCDKTRAELGLVRFPHPPTSPGLNPIENAWFELQSRLAGMQPRSRKSDDSWVCCLRAWDDIPMEYINKLVEGMPRRLEAVKVCNGWPTKYSWVVRIDGSDQNLSSMHI